MEKLLGRKNQSLFLLAFILLLGIGIRFYQLGKIPSSLNRDEAAIGYNAFSILKTGRDEWGEKLPLSFKSFGDFKSPFYIYLTVLPVAFFGLTEWSVRFWAALAGVLTVFISYFLTKELFNSKKKTYPLSVALLMAVSYWQVFYSRFSFEANLALFLNSLILYFLIKDNFKKANLFLLPLLPLSLLTYSSSLIIWPLFVFIWLIFLVKRKANLNQFLKLVFLLLVIGVVVFSQINISGQKKRVTIFADPQLRLTFNQQRMEASKNFLKAKIFHNQYLYFGKILISSYFQSFSWPFLFGRGGSHPWHKTPQFSHLNPLFFPLIIIGFWRFFSSQRIGKEKKWFLLLFFLLCPLSSAMTVDAPHATRLLNLFFFLTLLAGLGLGWLLERWRPAGLAILVVLFFNFFQFTNYYFKGFKNNPPLEILPGLKEAIVYLTSNSLGEERVVYSDHADGAYSYFLFYTSYPPSSFYQEVKRYSPDTAGLEWVEKFDKFVFVENPQPDQSKKEIYLLKGDKNLTPAVKKKIKNLFNDKIYFTITANF